MDTRIWDIVTTDMADTLARLGGQHVRQIAQLSVVGTDVAQVRLQSELPDDAKNVLVHKDVATRVDEHTVAFSQDKLQELIAACQVVMNHLNSVTTQQIYDFICADLP